jgi:hypothetical protein
MKSLVWVAADRIEIRLSRAKVAAALEAEGASQRPDLDPVVVLIEAKLRRAGKGKRLVIENGAEAEVNAGLAATITEAFAIRKQRLSGSDDSIEAMTERLGTDCPAHKQKSAPRKISQPRSVVSSGMSRRLSEHGQEARSRAGGSSGADLRAGCERPRLARQTHRGQ